MFIALCACNGLGLTLASFPFLQHTLICFIVMLPYTTRALLSNSCCRVVHQLKGERSFHIFYQLLRGLKDTVKRRQLYLPPPTRDAPKAFKCLSQSMCWVSRKLLQITKILQMNAVSAYIMRFVIQRRSIWKAIRDRQAQLLRKHMFLFEFCFVILGGITFILPSCIEYIYFL